MEKAISYIILLASLITALGTISNVFLIFGKSSKKGVGKFIELQMKPNFDKINNKLDDVDKKIMELDATGDAREMKRLRYECLCFASDVRKGEAKTRQEYEEIFRMENDYDELIAKHNVQNGFMEEEMLFVHDKYKQLNQ